MKAITCEKARVLYGDIVKQNPETSTEETPVDTSKAIHGWFDYFQKRTGVHIVVRYGNAASFGMKAAKDLLREFRQLTAAEEYIADQNIQL